MTRIQKFETALWTTLVIIPITVAILLKCSGCSSESATRQAVRSAVALVASLCQPKATVEECINEALERAEYLPEPADGGRE